MHRQADTGRAPLQVRRGRPEDAARLAAFAADTFSDAFGADNRPEDMGAFLSAKYGIAQQTSELTDPDCITLLVEEGAALAAYAQVRRSTAPACVTGAEPIEIWRFYVHRQWHGRGVAQRLMAAALEAARELGGRTVWLGVWERNPRGIAFYEKCGFRQRGGGDFWVGADRQTDRIMVLDPATR